MPTAARNAKAKAQEPGEHPHPLEEYDDMSLSWAELLGEAPCNLSSQCAVLVRRDDVPPLYPQPNAKVPRDKYGELYWDMRDAAWYNRKNEKRIERPRNGTPMVALCAHP